MEDRRKWNNIPKVKEEITLSSQNSISSKNTFRKEGEIKTFSMKEN